MKKKVFIGIVSVLSLFIVLLTSDFSSAESSAESSVQINPDCPNGCLSNGNGCVCNGFHECLREA